MITKLDPSVHTEGQGVEETRTRLAESLATSREALGQLVLPAVLLHRFAHRHACAGKLWRSVLAERHARRIGALGVSATTPEEAWTALEDPDIEILQVAASLLDLRLFRQGFFPRARELGRTVYVRSVFLQGVAHLEPHALPNTLADLREPLRRVHATAEELGVPPRALFLAFARECLPDAHLSMLVAALPTLEAESVDPSRWPALRPCKEPVNQTTRGSIATIPFRRDLDPGPPSLEVALAPLLVPLRPARSATPAPRARRPVFRREFPPRAGDGKLVEGIAAQVGNDIVLTSEVFEMSAPVEQRMRQAGAPESEVVMMRRDALERLIEGKLLSSVVERLELGADREEVDGAIDAIAEENGLTIEQLLKSVTSHGLTVEEYRQKIKGEIERGKVVNAMVRSRVEVSDEEVQALYEERFGDQPEGGEEVYVRHILVMPDGRSASSLPEACGVTRGARIEITAGTAEFAQLAERFSDMNPERGGDLGWLHRKDIAAWMAEAIDPLSPGTISPVIEMPFGCNLLQLVDRREFAPISFDQAAPRLRNYLFQRKTEEQYTEWLDVLREQTYIDRKGVFGG